MATFRSAGAAVEVSATSVVVEYTLTAGDRLYALVSAVSTAAPDSVVSDVDGALSLVGAWPTTAGFRNIGLYELAGATAGAHEITATFGASVPISALAFGYDDADGAVTSANQSEGATGSETSSLTLGTTTIAGGWGEDSFGWSMAGAVFSGKAIAVMVTAGTGLTFTPTLGALRHAADTGNFGLYLLDRGGSALLRFRGGMDGGMDRMGGM